MHVIDAMTAETGFGSILVFVINMAAIAFKLFVFAGEPEIGFVVIETQLGPQSLAMTLGAFFAQASLMRVFLVALVALRRSFAMFFIFLMAQGTLQSPVRAL